MPTAATIIAALLLVLVPGSARGGIPAFRVQVLTLDTGERCTPFAGDFDGDRLTELLVWNGKTFDLLQEENGVLCTVAEGLELPGGARLFDVADMDGDGTDEIVYLASDGLYAWAVGREPPPPPEAITAARCDLAGDYVGPAPLVIDVDGNGRGDVAWVEGSRLRIHLTPLPGQIPASQPLPLVEAGRPVKPEGLPFRVFLRDLDGDAEYDLLCVTPDGLSAFAPGAGCFDASSGWRLPFAPYLDESDAREFTDQDLEDVLFVEDVTGDGRPDLFLSSWSRGEVLMFAGDDDFFEEQPAQTLKPGAVVTRIQSLEWGEFDRQCLVVSRFIPPGKVGAAFKMIAGRKITATVQFLLYEPQVGTGQFFDPAPSLEWEIQSYAGRKDFETAPHYLLFATEEGDFDADGWKDLVGAGDSTTVEFYESAGSDEIERKDGRRLRSILSGPPPEPMPIAEFYRWSHRRIREQVGLRKPDLEVTVPSMQGYFPTGEKVADLNADGRPDLVLPYHPLDDDWPGRLVLLISGPLDDLPERR